MDEPDVRFLGGRNLHLIVPSLSSQGDILHARTLGWPNGYLPYLQMYRYKLITSTSWFVSPWRCNDFLAWVLPRTRDLEYCWVLHIGVRGKFSFKTTIFAQQFSKLTPSDGNYLINGFLDFLQPHFSFPIPVLQIFLCCRWVLCRLGMQTLILKAPEILENSISLCTVRIDFNIRDSSQMKFAHITGMNNIVTRPTNERQPFKYFNGLTIPHSVISSQETYRIRFLKRCTEHLDANERCCNGLSKGVHLDQFKNKFRKGQHACLRTLTSLQ